MTRRCKHCKEPLLNNQRWYCNTNCAVAHANTPQAPRVCVVCGEPLTGRQTRFCSRACNTQSFNRKNRERKKQAPPAADGKCIECSTPLSGAQTRFCSHRCRSRHHEARLRAARAAARPLRACPVCGSKFRGPHNKRYCRSECQLAAQRARKRGEGPLSEVELREVPGGQSVRDVIARVKRANPELAARMRLEQEKWESVQ